MLFLHKVNSILLSITIGVQLALKTFKRLAKGFFFFASYQKNIEVISSES
jgi:hypothetical protein